MADVVMMTKADLGQSRIVHTDFGSLAEGAVRLKIESFSVTANNVTYAVIGDMFGYWNFFPTNEEGQGIVPVWGHAVVDSSNHPDIIVGERVYGYLPMASHLDVLPGSVSAGGFLDTAAHRQPMSIVYNQYSRLAVDPEHDPVREDTRMIFGPLFKTGFLIEAMMRRESFFGAGTLIMTSASSKTAMALAHCAKTSSPAVTRIGMTSTANVDFVKATGLYDAVLPYDACQELAQTESVVVDFAGNAGLLRSIHEALGDHLKYSCLVGATHVEARGRGEAAVMPGPRPILFFAPDHATATIKELGSKGFGQAVAESWRSFVSVTDGFMAVDHREGLQAAADAFAATLKGTADPGVGIVIRP